MEPHRRRQLHRWPTPAHPECLLSFLCPSRLPVQLRLALHLVRWQPGCLHHLQLRLGGEWLGGCLTCAPLGTLGLMCPLGVCAGVPIPAPHARAQTAAPVPTRWHAHLPPASPAGPRRRGRARGWWARTQTRPGCARTGEASPRGPRAAGRQACGAAVHPPSLPPRTPPVAAHPARHAAAAAAPVAAARWRTAWSARA